MELNTQEKLYSTNNNLENSKLLKSPDYRSQKLGYGLNQSTRSTMREMVSPTYRAESKEFTSTLRRGNKSSSKVRLRSANSFSLNTNNLNDLSDYKYGNIKSNESRDKSQFLTNTYGDNGETFFYRQYHLINSTIILN